MRPSPQSAARSERSELLASGDAPRVALLLVTSDDTLWTPVSGLSPGREPRQFDSVAELTAQWSAERPAVVLIDGRGGALDAEVQALQTHSTALVPIAIVDEASRVAAAALERRRALFDHVLLPIDVGTARSIIERAAEESSARLSLADAERPVERSLAPAKRPERPLGLWIGIGIVAVAVLAGAALWLSKGSETPAPAAAVPAASAPASGPGTAAPAAAPAPTASSEDIEAQLERARAAMRDKRYIDPASDNALLHYKTVLELDAQNGEARQGVDRIAELLIARAAASLGARDYASALRSLEAARSVKPDHPRLAALDQQVNSHLKELSAAQVQAALAANAFARAAALLSQAEKTGALPADQIAALRADAARREAAAQVADLAHLAQVRITQGRLLDPANDSARGYLRQLQERGGAGAADTLAHLYDAYAKRLAADARAAYGRGATADYEALLAELRTVDGGAFAAQAQSLQRELDRGREQARARAEADAKAAADAEAKAATAAAAPVAAGPVAATPPKLTKALTLDYPERAAAAGVEGWVEVHFDVNTAGVAENLRVAAAQPAGTFDAAALNAIRRARFTPAMTADGTPIAQPTTLKLRFTLGSRK
ncbi:MAG: energy transducer TonB [Proteobacteria bacterium]|nr:energy transducer TonB [Pseudomonadota bacterium]